MASIYKRGHTWWGRVQRQGSELRQSLKTPVEGVARKRLNGWLEELDRIAWGEKPRRTFDDLTLRFIDQHLPRLKPGSAKRYLVSIEALTDSFEGLFLDEIGSARIAEFEAERRRGGQRIAARWRGLRQPKAIAVGTIRRDLACLSSIFGFGIEIEWCEANPVPAYMKRAKKRGLRETPPRRRYLSSDEETRLLIAAGDQHGSPELQDAIALAIDTGLRRDELLGLTRGQARLDKNAIVVSENTTKNSKAREVPLLPRARSILAQKPVQIRSAFVLINPATGTRYGALNKGLTGAAKRAGIEPLIWHDLRRTCGCRLLQDHGLSMEEVSRWLGHSSIAVTETTYAFLKDEHLQRAVATGTKTGTGHAHKIGKPKGGGGDRG